MEVFLNVCGAIAIAFVICASVWYLIDIIDGVDY